MNRTLGGVNMKKKLTTLTATAALLTAIGCSMEPPKTPEPTKDLYYNADDLLEEKWDSDYLSALSPKHEVLYGGCLGSIYLRLESLAEKSLEEIE